MRQPKVSPYGRTGSKRINQAQLRALLGDQVSILGGRVYREPDAVSHWDYDGVTGEMTVSVRLDQHEAVVWALWGPGVLGPNLGVIAPPAEGTEVEVGFPAGDFEGDPVVLSAMSTGAGVPDGDLQVGRLLVVGDEIWLYNGTGTPKALALKEDVDALETFLKKHFDTLLGHTHAALNGPPNTPGTGVVGTGYSVPSATGTSDVKGK